MGCHLRGHTESDTTEATCSSSSSRPGLGVTVGSSVSLDHRIKKFEALLAEVKGEILVILGTETGLGWEH